MFWSVLYRENSRLWNFPLLWGGLLLFAFISTLLASLAWTTPLFISSSDYFWPNGLLMAFDTVSIRHIGGAVLLVLVAAYNVQRLSRRTGALWYQSSVTRSIMLGARFVALFGLMVLLLLFSLLWIGALSLFYTFLMHGSVPLVPLSTVQVVLSCARTLYTQLPYVALAFMLALVTRSWPLACGLPLVIVFVLEPLLVWLLGLPGVPCGWVVQYLPSQLSAALLQLNAISLQSAVPVQQNLLAPALGLAAYTMSFLLGAWIVFQVRGRAGEQG